MKIELRLGKYTRCDIVAYKAINLAGKRTTLRIFPTGSIQGKLFTEDLKSMIIRAPYGMRVILCTTNQDDWEDHPYRCITIEKGVVIPPTEPGSLRGVRIPDLDFLSPPSTKRESESLQRTYPIIEHFADGEGWSFGTIGGTKLKANIKMIIFERVEVGEAPPLSESENMARVLLSLSKDAQNFEALRAKALETLKQKREKASLEKWIQNNIKR